MKNNQFFTTELATAYWLDSINIQDYYIHNDLTVDVNQNVIVKVKNLNYIPVQFGIVKGNFNWQYNSLVTLKGSPYLVTGYVNCSDNQLTSLEYGPEKVGMDFNCFRNQLISLKNAPKTVGGDFVCSSNKINNLEDLNIKVARNFQCINNPITSFNKVDIDIKKDIYLTPLPDMKHLDVYKDYDGDIMMNFNEFKKLQELKQLNDKLSHDLSINPRIIKHKI